MTSLTHDTYTFGFDLGTNSLGWAVVDEATKTLVDGGVVIIPRCTEDKNETPKNHARRAARQARRQLARRSARKQMMRSLLKEHGLFPAMATKASLQEVRLASELQRFISQDPYALRKQGAEGAYLHPMQLGRVLYHLAQRRGYPAGDISNLDAMDEKELGAIFAPPADKKEKEGKIGINETEEALNRQDEAGKSLHPTLGHYLATLKEGSEQAYLQVKEGGGGDLTTLPTLRKRYLLRARYQEEFEHLWKMQAPHHPSLLTEELKEKLSHILFFQRPLRDQSHLIGMCTLEPKQRRAPKSSPITEAFKVYQFLNNIRVAGEPLDDQWRDRLVKLIKEQKKSLAFEKVHKKHPGFLLDELNYGSKDELPTMPTYHAMATLFGKKQWKGYAPEEQYARWHYLYHATDMEALYTHARNTWGLFSGTSEEDKAVAEKELCTAKKALTRTPAHLSEKAMKAMLPYLKEGYGYALAAPLGSLPSLFGTRWEAMTQEEQQAVKEEVKRCYQDRASDNCGQAVQAYLVDQHGLTPQRIARKLYHHAKPVDGDRPLREDLPPKLRPDTRNPVVNHVLAAFCRLVKEMIQRFGRPKVVRIELARSLKQGAKAKKRIDKVQKANKKANDRAREYLRGEQGMPNPSKPNIRKYRLWEECGHICPYTGLHISAQDLFDTSLFDIEHIIPRSISLDDSMRNLTLCHKEVNQAKGNRTPYQAFGGRTTQVESVTVDWDKLVGCVEAWGTGKASKALKAKMRRMCDKEDPNVEGFLHSQLSDTAYIGIEARKLAAHLCKTVHVVKGGTTDILRHQWGLSTLLSPSIPLPEDGAIEEGRYMVAVDAKRAYIDHQAKHQEDKVDGGKKKNPYKAYKELGEQAKQEKGYLLEGHVRKGYFYPFKNREDHRHHLIDAVTIACTSQGALQKLSKWYAEQDNHQAHEQLRTQERHLLDCPWPRFRYDVEELLDHTLVMHTQRNRSYRHAYKRNVHLAGSRRKVRSQGSAVLGQLHNDTLYGLRKKPGTGELGLHVRKSIYDTKLKVDKIVDEKVREIVRAWKERYDHYLKEKKRLKEEKKNHKEEDLVAAPPKPAPPALPIYNKDKKVVGSVPIKKVRVRMQETQGKAVPLRPDVVAVNPSTKEMEHVNTWVEPGNNYIAAIYCDPVTGKWHDEVYSLWEIVKRKRELKRDPSSFTDLLAHASYGKPHFTMRIGDLFLLDLDPARITDWDHPTRADYATLYPHLYRVQKLSKQYQALHGQYVFRKHHAATLLHDAEMKRITSFRPVHPTKQSTSNATTEAPLPIKVRLNAMGKLVDHHIIELSQ